MARPISDLLQEAGVFIQNNPGLFNGVVPGNIIAHLGTVNPDLWNQFNETFRQSGGGSSLAGDIAKGAAAGTIALPGIGTALGAGSGALAHLTGAGAPTLNEWAAANPELGQALIGAPPPAPPAPKLPDQTTPTQAYQIPNIQGTLESLFAPIQQQGINQINRASASKRQQAIDEAAAMGNLSSTGALTDIDRQTLDSISGYIANLDAQKVAESNQLESYNLSNRSLEQQAKQFAANYGLAQNGQNMQGQMYNDSMNLQRQANAIAEMTGRQQAEAAKPSLFDQITGGIGAFGQMAGGAGQLLGGINSFKMAGAAGAGAAGAAGPAGAAGAGLSGMGTLGNIAQNGASQYTGGFQNIFGAPPYGGQFPRVPQTVGLNNYQAMFY